MEAIVSDPVLVRWDHRKRFYLQTDFCAKGMGFVGMQPASDALSMAAMFREIDGGPCKFMRDPPQDDPSNQCHSSNQYALAAAVAKGMSADYTLTLTKASRVIGH